MIIECISKNPEMTKKTGMLFSKMLGRFEVALLSGELGAGKTTFIAGAASGLGIKENISSPSFAIFNVYTTRNKRKFIHADLYRLDSIDEIINTGIEDYFYDNKSLVFIEWGTKLMLWDYFKMDSVEIEFSYLNDTKRMIIFKSSSRRWDKKLEKFKAVLKKCRYLE